MPITEKPPMFEAHGREFEKKADAERWNEIYEAQEEYESARSRFMNAISTNMRTADGHLFKRMLHYWRVREVHRGMACLEEVSAYEYAIELFEWDGGATDRVQIRLPRKNRSDHPSGEWFAVDIGDLYRSEKAARTAVLESHKATLAEWQARIAEMEART